MIAIQDKLEIFSELILCAHDLYTFSCDEALNVIQNNCPSASVYHDVFKICDGDMLKNNCHTRDKPVILTNTTGLVWVVDFETSLAGQRLYHLIGPVFNDDMDIRQVQQELDNLGISVSLKSEFMKIIHRIPVIPATRMREYSLMLHYCLTGEKLSVSKIEYLSSENRIQQKPDEKIDRHGTYQAEKAILKLIELGDLNYRPEMDRLASMGRIGSLGMGDSLRQAKNQVLIFTALSARAAMHGGLLPDTAYTLSDHYIQLIEACTSIAEIVRISRSMVEDYVRRVNRCRQKTELSRDVQACCDFISLHASENVSIRQLAEREGYTEYYFSRKFKKEVGRSMRDFICSAKIDLAKDLLAARKNSVSTIGEKLGFGSTSYFCEVFRSITGVSPGEYRKRYHAV